MEKYRPQPEEQHKEIASKAEITIFENKEVATSKTADELALLLQRELFAKPGYTPKQLKKIGGNPRQRWLIRIDDPDSDAIKFPSFQFDKETGKPYPIVLKINKIFDAENDPYATADWWLGTNGWINDIPANFIGKNLDGMLVALAKAEIDNDYD